MTKCCVCDEKGTKLAKGFWWCDEHYEIVGKQIDESSIADVDQMKNESSSSVDLDLQWV